MKLYGHVRIANPTRPIEPKIFYILQAKERGLTTYIKIRRPTKDIEKRPWHTYHYALEVCYVIRTVASTHSAVGGFYLYIYAS